MPDRMDCFEMDFVLLIAVLRDTQHTNTGEQKHIWVRKGTSEPI